MEERAPVDGNLYELLKLRGDGAGSDAQLEILRHLRAVESPAREQSGVDELERQHFEQFLRLRRDETRSNPPAVSGRRAALRAKCRDRWKATSEGVGVSVETVKQRLPGLFREEPNVAASTNSNADARMNAAPLITAPVPASSNLARGRMNVVDEFPVQRTSVQHRSVPVHAERPGPPPPQQPALGDMFRKRAPLPHEEIDMDSPPVIPRTVPPAQRGMASRNPFQTAGDKLQHDRLTGRDKTMNDDDDGYRGGKSNRGLSGRQPRGNSYHPINPKLLFGANGQDQDDMDDVVGSSAIRKKFVSPVVGSGGDKKQPASAEKATAHAEDPDIDPRLKSCDPDLIAKIEMEIVDYGDPVAFDDIAGLQFAKKCVNELVIWPMARPDIFTGLRSLPKGLLLFGPPGTGKTLIGKAIANQSGATFFSISASSLTSKWIGEGEKLVRTLFAVAAVKQPSVIFIDEIDSLLTQRSSEENEASRRMKTEFLVQLDGAGTKADDIVLVVGATNRPQELDEAARRRFVKRLYIPLPSFEARLDLVNRLLKNNKHELTPENIHFIADSTKGYSGADIRALCTEAAMGPIRSCVDIRTMDANAVRPINLDDFVTALRGVRSSVGVKDLQFYREWNDEFGSFPFESNEDD